MLPVSNPTCRAAQQQAQLLNVAWRVVIKKICWGFIASRVLGLHLTALTNATTQRRYLRHDAERLLHAGKWEKQALPTPSSPQPTMPRRSYAAE